MKRMHSHKHFIIDYPIFYQLRNAQEKIEELNKEQESLIDIFSEERDRRDNEEKNLRRKLQVAH